MLVLLPSPIVLIMWLQIDVKSSNIVFQPLLLFFSNATFPRVNLVIFSLANLDLEVIGIIEDIQNSFTVDHRSY